MRPAGYAPRGTLHPMDIDGNGNALRKNTQPISVACLRQEDSEGGRAIGALKTGFAGKGVDTATGKDSKEVAAGPPTSQT